MLIFEDFAVMKSNIVTHILSSIIDFFYPPFCFDCGGKVHSREFFCKLCIDLILKEPTPEVELFVDQPVDRIISAYDFENPLIRKSIHALKYSGMKTPASELLKYRLPILSLLPYDYIVPVPLHWRRKFKRGYNQSLILAKVLRLYCEKSEIAEPIRRCTFTITQTKKRRWERKKAMHHVFELRQKRVDLSGKTIAIIDDVCTTGSTARSCAQLLKEAGAVQVDLITIGRA